MSKLYPKSLTYYLIKDNVAYRTRIRRVSKACPRVRYTDTPQGCHIRTSEMRLILSPLVYDIKHLSLAVYECCRYQYIIDHMLWMCDPQILTISRATDYKFLKVGNFLP